MQIIFTYELRITLKLYFLWKLHSLTLKMNPLSEDLLIIFLKSFINFNHKLKPWRLKSKIKYKKINLKKQKTHCILLFQLKFCLKFLNWWILFISWILYFFSVKEIQLFIFNVPESESPLNFCFKKILIWKCT